MILSLKDCYEYVHWDMRLKIYGKRIAVPLEKKTPQVCLFLRGFIYHSFANFCASLGRNVSCCVG